MPDSAFNLPTNERIHDLIVAGKYRLLEQVLDTYHPADIADLLDELPNEESLIIFELLPDHIASEVLDETHSLIRQELVEKVDDERLADLLDELPMDDAAEFVAGLPEPVGERLLDLMEPEEAQEVRQLLNYPDQTAGRLMTTDVARLQRDWTVDQSLDYLRNLQEVESLHYLYVVDVNNTLLGIAPLRQLLLAQPHQTIANIKVTDVARVLDTADQEELALFISKYDYFSIPVVNEKDELLGVVTVDDALDVLAEEATEDIQRLGGSEPLAKPYFSASIRQMVGKRLIWLLPLFVASVITDSVINAFGGLLITAAALNTFIPVVSGTGGNAGSQTVATIIRAMAVGEVKLVDLRKAWLREVSVALILGAILGTAGFIRATLFNAGYEIALVLALTLPLVVIVANTLATLIPLIAQRANIDPTVVSAPMITTFVDASGLLIYFTLATIIL